MSIGFNGTSQGTAPTGDDAAGNPLQVGGVTATGKMQPLLVADDGTLQVSGGGGGSSVVTQPDQTLLKDTSYQGGTWTVGLSAGANAIGSVTVSNLPATQPVSGTVATTQSGTWNVGVTGSVAVTGTFWQATQPVSAASLPLPTGAATAANQTSVQGTAGSPASSVVSVQGVGGGTAIPISGTVTANNASVSATGSAVPASATMVGGTDGTTLRAILTDSSGRQVVNVNGTVPVSGTFWQATQPVSGTVTANIGTTNGLALDATLTGGTQKTQLVASGGTVANIDTAGNQAIRGGFAEQTGLSVASLNGDLVSSTDVSAYKWFSLQVLTAGSGTLTFQGSNDNSTWVSVAAILSSAVNSVLVTTTTAAGMYYGAVNYRYLRVRATAYTSGTFTGVLELYTSPSVFQTMGIGTVASSQSGTWTVQPGNSVNTTPWLVNALLNPSGTLLNTYSTRITTNTTTTPTSSTAYISSITISSEVAGTTSTLTIQDKQGTPLKLVNGLTTVAVTTTPTILNFQTPVKMTSGIDIITAGVAAATLDIWINYYQ